MKNLRYYFLSIIKKYALWLPENLYIRLLYYFDTGRILNLNRPQRFTEKIQWLKLWYRHPLLPQLVDKISVKEFVIDKIGNKYIIPTIATFEDPNKIDFDTLPDKFVLKPSFGGGSNGVIICNDKKNLDKADVIAKLSSAYKSNIYKRYREWPYSKVPRRIIAETLLEDPNHSDIMDYKFYCFNGMPCYCQVIANRRLHETIDFYDIDWVHQPFWGLNRQCFQAGTLLERPSNYDEMIKIASVLSHGLPFVRVDLYNIAGEIYFGELTFYPASGLGTFTPDLWDFRLGNLLSLPSAKINR